jgi:predicted metal-dependent phosphoesterase TrpH
VTIDLHLHTTASDGRCSPRELVDRVARAGVTVMAVTDHDTTAAISEVEAVAAEHRIDVVAGIEVTAVENGRDVHILGYFIDPANVQLAGFLARQRAQRMARVKAIGDRLALLGIPVDIKPILKQASEDGGRSVGRPQIARAMIAAGHVRDTREAFDEWLAAGRPAYVSRAGAPPEDVIGIIHDAGGLASLAHPGQTGVDARISVYQAAGLDALEIYHPDHDAVLTERYRALAAVLGLAETGGSDFHGDPSHGWEPGAVTLPADAWQRLRDAAPHA